MRAIFFSASVLLLATACGGPRPFDFNDASTDKDASVDDSGNPVGDSGCPFCGVDSSNDGATPTCSPNPANFDVPGNGCDDDGDGTVDNPIGTCDTGLPTASPTAAQFGKAIGICPNTGNTWGVTSASYTQGVGSNKAPMAQQYGTNATFGTGGVKARQGKVLGILSSGVAAAQDCGTGEFKGNVCTSTGAGVPPPGYPKASKINNTSCPVSSVANDVVDVVLKIQVPANAKGFSFDFNFYSGEWPEYVCTTFNDSFVAWLTSTAWKGNGGDFNISFDPNKNPVSVNNSFFEVCSPAGLKCGNMPVASTCKLDERAARGHRLRDAGERLLLHRPNGLGRRRNGLAHDASAGHARRDHHAPVHGVEHRRRGVRLERPPRQLPVDRDRHRRLHRASTELSAERRR